MRVFLLFVLVGLVNGVYAESIAWPQQQKLAISLSYDDALATQLDNAIPTLDKYKLKASFYVFPASDSFRSRLEEWRNIAKNGHELGNHTLYHNCSKKLSGDWVREYVDLDLLSVERMVMDVRINNTLLQALDGRTARTFTTPCGHVNAKDGNYVAQLNEDFVASKGQGIAGGFSVLASPVKVSARQMIRYIENAPRDVKLVNILFHGIGGDHLSVPKKEHDKLLEYLAKNRDIYWVDTYLNIMQHVLDHAPEAEKVRAGYKP